MNLTILLPSRVFIEQAKVLRLVVETSQGSWGILPQRLDCVAALVPGILTFEPRSGSVAYVAVDIGVLMKAGTDVRVSVRRAVAGSDLGRLRDTVQRDYEVLEQSERETRRVIATLENAFIRRMGGLHHD